MNNKINTKHFREISQETFSVFESVLFIGTRLFILIALSALTISLIRGFIPILLGDLLETKYIYFTLSGLILLCASYSIFTINNSIFSIRLNQILVINLFFYVIWFIVDFSANGDMFFFISVAIFPFLILLYSKIPSLFFNRAIFFLVPIIAGAVIIDYLLINTDVFNGGVYQLGISGETVGWEIREKLRYLVLSERVAPSHLAHNFLKIDGSFNNSGTSYRAVGLAGDEHDTSSILVMLSAFILAVNNLKLGYKIVLLSMAYLALFFTAATSNIIFGFLIALIIIIYKMNLFKMITMLILLVIFLLILSLILPGFFDFLKIPFMKFYNREIISLMFSRQVDINFASEVMNILLGHTSNLKISQFGTLSEFGFIRVLYNAGIFPFISLMSLWFFPMILFIKTDKYTRSKMFPYLAAFYGGVMTLSHYGSVLRSSNIVLFYSFFGMSIRMYFLSRNYLQMNNSFLNKELR